MTRKEIRDFGYHYIKMFELRGWDIEVCELKKNCRGMCDTHLRMIRISDDYVWECIENSMYAEAAIKNVILHEIAHAIVHEYDLARFGLSGKPYEEYYKEWFGMNRWDVDAQRWTHSFTKSHGKIFKDICEFLGCSYRRAGKPVTKYYKGE